MLQSMKDLYTGFLINLSDMFQKKRIDVKKILFKLQLDDKYSLSMFANDNNMMKDLRDLPEDEAIDEMFYQIKKHWRFFDYGVIDDVIKKSKCKEAEDEIQKYTEEMKEILLLAMPCEVIQQKSINHERNIRILKIKCEKEEIDITHWNSIKNAVCRCFDLPEGTLKFDNTMPGCVIIICKILLQAKDHLMKFKITKHCLKPLASMKITYLKIDDKVELTVPSECDTEVTTYSSTQGHSKLEKNGQAILFGIFHICACMYACTQSYARSQN